MKTPTIIDTKMHGRTSATAAFLVEGEDVAIVETGPKTSLQHVYAGLNAAGVEDLRWIVVTHIHLDHAGAAGTLAARFPDAKVAVHEIGAPHLADPTKLWKSATRIYGDAMEQLWDGIDPIPEDRIHVVRDGDEIDLGGRRLRAIETPGHAWHHHAFLDDATGILFSGDALGVRLPGIKMIRPTTPPPELDLEAALASIEKIRGVGAERLWFTHFPDTGESASSIDDICDRAGEALRTWAKWVEEARGESRDLDQVARLVQQRARAEAEGALPADVIDRLEQTTSYRMNVSGYMRYFDKKESAVT